MTGKKMETENRKPTEVRLCCDCDSHKTCEIRNNEHRFNCEKFRKAKKKYDFSWVDEKISELKEKGQTRGLSDIELVNTLTFPHNVFSYYDPFQVNLNTMRDGGGQEFYGDEEEYKRQLEKFKKKYGK